MDVSVTEDRMMSSTREGNERQSVGDTGREIEEDKKEQEVRGPLQRARERVSEDATGGGNGNGDGDGERKRKRRRHSQEDETGVEVKVNIQSQHQDPDRGNDVKEPMREERIKPEEHQDHDQNQPKVGKDDKNGSEVGQQIEITHRRTSGDKKEELSTPQSTSAIPSVSTKTLPNANTKTNSSTPTSTSTSTSTSSVPPPRSPSYSSSSSTIPAQSETSISHASSPSAPVSPIFESSRTRSQSKSPSRSRSRSRSPSLTTSRPVLLQSRTAIHVSSLHRQTNRVQDQDKDLGEEEAEARAGNNGAGSIHDKKGDGIESGMKAERLGVNDVDSDLDTDVDLDLELELELELGTEGPSTGADEGSVPKSDSESDSNAEADESTISDSDNSTPSAASGPVATATTKENDQQDEEEELLSQTIRPQGILQLSSSPPKTMGRYEFPSPKPVVSTPGNSATLSSSIVRRNRPTPPLDPSSLFNHGPSSSSPVPFPPQAPRPPSGLGEARPLTIKPLGGRRDGPATAAVAEAATQPRRSGGLAAGGSDLKWPTRDSVGEDEEAVVDDEVGREGDGEAGQLTQQGKKELEKEDEHEDDFYKERSIFVNVPVGSLSISPSNRDVCLASRKGLFILDMQYPDQVPRWIPQGGFSQIADCQWSPHPATSNLILTTSSQKLLVWDLASTSPSTSLYRSIDAHHRAITDINWHARDPNLMATTSIDGAVKCWDLRVAASKHSRGNVSMGTAVVRLADWGDAGTQVKWNRQHDHILASAHGNKVRIWDTRKGAVPITEIEAHSARIYGIDWDRRTRHQIVTCSLDKTIKYWSINELDRANVQRYGRNPYFPSVPAATEPTATIVTKNPVWRARNLPFGHGVLSLPQRGDSALEMWGKQQGEGPLERFEEYSAPVKEFVWRTRGGQDPTFEDREFQLITWSKDRRLRMWPLKTDVLEKAGYRRGAPIDVLVSRRNAVNISYANIDRESGGSPASTPGIMPDTPNSLMTDFKSERMRAMSVRTKVDVPQPTRFKHRSEANIGATMTRGTIGGKSKKSRALDQLDWIGGISTIRRNALGKVVCLTPGGSSTQPSRGQSVERNMTSSLMRSWYERSNSVDEDDQNMDLADEIRQVKRRFPRAKFESRNLNIKKRTCSIALNGPWAEDGRMTFIRIYFRFPASYPRTSPQFSLSDSLVISKETMESLKKAIHRICETNRPCLSPCIAYLMGHEETGARLAAPDSDSDSDLDTDMNIGAPAQSVGKVTCGASWGPSGTLVTFFLVAPPVTRRISPSPSNGSGSIGKVTNPNVSLLKAMSALSLMRGDYRTRRTEEARRWARGLERVYRSMPKPHSITPPELGRHRPHSALAIRSIMGSGRELAARYACGGGFEACNANARLAIAAGNVQQASVWKMVAALLMDGRGGRKMVRMIEDRLLALRDVQMLALMFAFLEEHGYVNEVPTVATGTLKLPSKWSLSVSINTSLPTTSALDPTRLALYECYKRFYAELLQRWELHVQATEVLNTKYLPIDEPEEVGLNIALTSAACSICQLPIRGLSVVCLTCAHPIHLECLYEIPITCPTGCGCRCVQVGGMAGKFEAVDVEVITESPTQIQEVVTETSPSVSSYFSKANVRKMMTGEGFGGWLM